VIRRTATGSGLSTLPERLILIISYFGTFGAFLSRVAWRDLPAINISICPSSVSAFAGIRPLLRA
jgi:hypothetical protein